MEECLWSVLGPNSATHLKNQVRLKRFYPSSAATSKAPTTPACRELRAVGAAESPCCWSVFQLLVGICIYLCIYLSICLIYLSIYLSINLSIYPRICTCIYVPMYLSIHPSIYLFIYLSTDCPHFPFTLAYGCNTIFKPCRPAHNLVPGISCDARPVLWQPWPFNQTQNATTFSFSLAVSESLSNRATYLYRYRAHSLDL